MSDHSDKFLYGDLPVLHIPPELEASSDSNTDSETDELVTMSSTPSTPLTPGTPVSQIAASVTSFTFSETESATPSQSPRSKGVKKIHTGRFSKGHKRRALFVTPKKIKRSSIPRSELLKGTVNTSAPSTYLVNLKEGGKMQAKHLLVPQGSQVMNLEILDMVFQMLSCTDPTCHGSLRLHKLPHHDGLQSRFVLHCSRCHVVVANFSSSLYLDEQPREAVNSTVKSRYRPSEVNIRSMLAVHCTSLSWQDFRLTCALLGLQVPARNMSQAALDKLIATTCKVSQDTMMIASREVANQIDTVPSNIQGAARCHVSFDASWHRRGHYSNQGFGAVIDSNSGKVLDYDLLQRVCKKCLAWPEERKTSEPEEYSSFCAEHGAVCTANFMGTSQAMEGAIAIKLWKRSVAQNQLVYTTYIGDGDSSSYKKLVESNPYEGLETVRKEECLGHVQKRLKKHLKKASPTSPAVTKSKVERVGHLYALVVVRNRGNSAATIQQALFNLVDHLGEQHSNCPCTTDSWCYFAKAQAERKDDSSVLLPPLRKPYLTVPEIDRCREVFTTFASIAMCSSLGMGKTQNSNEALHSIVWHNSPKGKYAGQKSMLSSTALAVSTFNEGSLSFAAVLNEYGISPSYSSLFHFAEMDRYRNSAKERAILATIKRRRRYLTVRASAAETSRKRREKAASKYSSGKFGAEVREEDSSDEDDDEVCAICEMKGCPIGRRRKVDEWIGCDVCGRWFHGRCVGIKKIADWTEVDYFCKDCEEP